MEVQQYSSFGVKPELLEILKSAGAKGTNFTFKEAVDYLKNYCDQQLLFDSHDTNKILCENDLLEKAFGVKMFTVSDIPKLLLSRLIPGPSSIERELGNDSFYRTPEKRKIDDCEHEEDWKKLRGENSGCNSRRRSPWCIYICPTPEHDSGSESVLSLQGYETALAQDSSDDDSSWYFNSGDYEVEVKEVDVDTDEIDDDMVEFEVQSCSSGICEENFSDTDSDICDIVSAAIFVSQNDSDEEFWADTSSNEQLAATDSDPEITDNDKWKCQHCSALNKPLIRFCQKCWQLRNGWLPERRRPKRNRRRLRRVLSAPDGMATLNEPKLPRRKNSRSEPDFALVNDITIGNSLSTRSDGEHDGSQESLPSTSGNSSESHLCSICLSKPKNASIVHGRTGHVISCYGCGMKLYKQKGTCPVCRRAIQKVIQNFVV